MSGLFRRAILQSVCAARRTDVCAARSTISGNGPACEWLKGNLNEFHGEHYSFAASVRQRVSASTVASAADTKDNSEDTPSALSRVEKTYRTGVLAVKVGMTQEFDHHGQRIPLSVLWMDDVQVTQIKPYNATSSSLQLGIGSKRRKQIPASLAGHFDAAGVPYKRKTKEFRVSNDAILPVGHTLTAAHFVPGQYVDVSGTTIGKGFQGVMKRWGFAGQPASHGNSLAHRKAGSTGMCQDPGKVFKGKKMAGRMGGTRATTMGCLVWRVDVDRGLVYVKGQVPGHKGNFVEVRDSRKTGGAVNDGITLPVPTGELSSGVFVAGKPARNPFEVVM